MVCTHCVIFCGAWRGQLMSSVVLTRTVWHKPSRTGPYCGTLPCTCPGGAVFPSTVPPKVASVALQLAVKLPAPEQPVVLKAPRVSFEPPPDADLAVEALRGVVVEQRCAGC